MITEKMIEAGVDAYFAEGFDSDTDPIRPVVEAIYAAMREVAVCESCHGASGSNIVTLQCLSCEVDGNRN